MRDEIEEMREIGLKDGNDCKCVELEEMIRENERIIDEKIGKEEFVVLQANIKQQLMVLK